jgi:hypothetical protein
VATNGGVEDATVKDDTNSGKETPPDDRLEENRGELTGLRGERWRRTEKCFRTKKKRRIRAYLV